MKNQLLDLIEAYADKIRPKGTAANDSEIDLAYLELIKEVRRVSKNSERYEEVRSWSVHKRGNPFIKTPLYHNDTFLGSYDYLEYESLDKWTDDRIRRKNEINKVNVP